MTLHGDSIRWAIEFTDRHSDGDIFPPIPEISAVSTQPEKLINALANRPLTDFQPQSCRRFIVPKDDLSYRQATQLHPQDSILLTAAIYQYGEGIERRRLSKDTVFSYRFNPVADHGLYGSERLWNDFWITGARKSESYPYVLYCDIADFYNQIYHHTVENQLGESRFPNQAIKWVIKLLESTTEGVSRGIPIGPHSAHMIAECTLIPIDNSLVASGLEFIRYADDIIIFCSSEHEARNALQSVATTLDKQQRLMLQRHKTEIIPADEFRERCMQMIEDRPINDDEKEILNIISQYSGGNPYATLTYNQISPDHWKAFSEEIVSGIVNDYLQAEQVDYIRLRWFFRRLAQVGHYGALEVTIKNINTLEPCLPSVCAYISSIQAIPPTTWAQLGGNLIDIIESGTIFESEFARLSILSLFSRNEHIDHFVRLARRFGSGDSHVRREILLAAKANSEADWVREQKENYTTMDPWQQMAFVYCASILPRDERRYFLKRHNYPPHFEEELARLAIDGKP